MMRMQGLFKPLTSLVPKQGLSLPSLKENPDLAVLITMEKKKILHSNLAEDQV
jgi:hypothetical protein